MKKNSKLSLKKLSLSKKTISFLGTESSEQIMGASVYTDPYSGGGPGTMTCGCYCPMTTAVSYCNNCNPQPPAASAVNCYSGWTYCGYCG